MIYLDSAATTMIKPAAVESAVVRAMRTMASPGRGAHKPAMRASDTVFECRQAAAELFSVDEPDKIIFTMNATHALNIAINSLAQKGMRVLVSGYEHNSVTRPLTQLGANIIIASSMPFDRDAILADFEKKLPNAELVVCTHVSNVFGFILPIYEIAALCRKHAFAGHAVHALEFVGDQAHAGAGAADHDAPVILAGLHGPAQRGSGVIIHNGDVLSLHTHVRYGVAQLLQMGLHSLFQMKAGRIRRDHNTFRFHEMPPQQGRKARRKPGTVMNTFAWKLYP